MASDTQTLIHHFLEKSAQNCPDKTALIHEGIRASYRQINAGANQLARWIIGQGIKRGDRIVLILKNCLEYVIAYYGVLKAGAVVTPLSSDLKPEGLRPLLEQLNPKLVISSGRFEKVLHETDLSPCKIQALILIRPKLKWSSAIFPVLSWQALIKDEESSNPNMEIDESALSSIIYTSGSTGGPKGVMLSHKNIVSNTRAICQTLRLTDKDIQMVVLPFFYVMGKSLLNTHFAVGGTVVINNKFAYPASVIRQMVDEQITGFSGVPATYSYLLHRSPLAAYRDKLHSLHYCAQAGGHMSRQVKKELRQVLPEHTKIFIMYGATEASARLTCLEPDRFEDKMDSIGRAVPGVTLRVLDTKGRELQSNQIGELVGSGTNIMLGYWQDDQTTSMVLDQNGYHTGDLGYHDSEGYLYVVGRKDNLVKVGGHRINPQEIEDALMETELLIELVVVGIPDEFLGHRLIALAAPKNENCTENQILSRCAERLPRYKLPSEIKLVKAVPKNFSGKIDRNKCLEIIGNSKI